MNDQRLDRLLQAAAIRDAQPTPMPSRLQQALRARRQARMWSRVATVGGMAALLMLAATAMHLSQRQGRPNPIDFAPGSPTGEGPLADRGASSPAALDGSPPTLGYYRRAIGPGGAGAETALDRAATRDVAGSAQPVRPRDIDQWLPR